MKYHAREMSQRVLVQRIARQYDNVNHFMHRIEQMFIESQARPINVIISKLPENERLRFNTPNNGPITDREATLVECQNLISMFGFGSNCFRCREDDGAQSGEHLLQVYLPRVILS